MLRGSLVTYSLGEGIAEQIWVLAQKKERREPMAKWPAITEDRLKKYEDLYQNRSSHDYLPKHVSDHFNRLKEAGIERGSAWNRDYLGAFLAPFSRNLKSADLAIVGAPVEYSTPSSYGTKFGPSALRTLSKKHLLGLVSNMMDLPFEMCRIIDYGQVDVFGLIELERVMNELEEHFRRIVVENGVNTLMWGGEHTVSYAPVKAYAEKVGPLGLIKFDAHFDHQSRMDVSYPICDANWLSRAFAEGLVDPERTIQIGLRGPSAILMRGLAEAYGTAVVTADEFWDIGAKAVAEKALKVVGDGPTYLTFDLDAMDTMEHRSNGAPEPFGISWRQVYDFTRHVRSANSVDLVGVDLAEYTPATDPTDKDGLMTVGYSFQLLCWLCERVARRNGEWRRTEWPQTFGLSARR
jgi:arginase family enzyme